MYGSGKRVRESVSLLLVACLILHAGESFGEAVPSSEKPPVKGKDDECLNTKCENLKKIRDEKDPQLAAKKAEEFMKRLAEKSWEEGHAEGTVGLCMHGVAQALASPAACNNAVKSVCGNASGSGKCLKAMGFQQCIFSPKNRDQLQRIVEEHNLIGAIFVYSGGPEGNGHIEVYAAKNDQRGWCSDHCTTKAFGASSRPPEAIYFPPNFKIPNEFLELLKPEKCTVAENQT